MTTPSSMPSGSDAYIRRHPYATGNQLEPEQTIIPPPDLDYSDGTPFFDLTDLETFNHLNGSCGNPLFIRNISLLHPLRLRHALMTWKYDQRASAQPILPFLFLGPVRAAKDSTFIQSKGITMLVAVRTGVYARQYPKFLNPGSFHPEKHLESAVVDLDTAYDLIRSLRGVIKSINDHLEKSCVRTPLSSIGDINGKVLVFCESGNERSAALVCAYLMIVYGVDAVRAIQIVQSQRFSISLKEDMKSMLLDFGEILIAERQVAADTHARHQLGITTVQPGTRVPTLNMSYKRGLNEVYESDEEMGEPNHDDVRSGSAPFADAGFGEGPT